ncbi:MAG TPA: DUF362 domain-containing protein [Anaerolineae bacterium]|jgi:hypothetical protein
MAEVKSDYNVRAVSCDYRGSDDEVYAALKRATDPLEKSWERLRKAKRIAIKFNQDWEPEKVAYHQGHRQQLVSDVVTRATLRLLREKTTASIFAVDVGVVGKPERPRSEMTTILPVLNEFGVPFIDGREDEMVWQKVPGGGSMFNEYPLPRSSVEADEMISVQKLKNHAFMGITLCLKNLFGLMKIPPNGRTRAYYHHLVRMPYMLADLGRIYNPALNIIDGLVCQAGEEWGAGEEPRICNTLIAGDQVIATDAVGAHLMGHDPQTDWGREPFHRDRNSLLCAAERGFGTVNLDEINWLSEVTSPVGKFFSKITDSREMVHSWRKTTAEQGLYYRDHKKELVNQYAGEYILLQMNEVKWHDVTGIFWLSRRMLSGEHPEQAMWLKYVDPDEKEGEHFEVYEKTLQSMPSV